MTVTAKVPKDLDGPLWNTPVSPHSKETVRLGAQDIRDLELVRGFLMEHLTDDGLADLKHADAYTNALRDASYLTLIQECVKQFLFVESGS